MTDSGSPRPQTKRQGAARPADGVEVQLIKASQPPAQSDITRLVRLVQRIVRTKQAS